MKKFEDMESIFLGEKRQRNGIVGLNECYLPVILEGNPPQPFYAHYQPLESSHPSTDRSSKK